MRKLEDFVYDPVTGVLSWRGRNIGTLDKSTGYLVCALNRKKEYVHRIVWRLMTGAWPTRIDHINGVRTDNRRNNLRDATASANAQNRPLRRTPLYGALPGAYYHKPSRRWKSAIVVHRQQLHLGYFLTPELASEAFVFAKEFFHDIPGVRYA